jgi:hypothetical protein
MPAYSVTCPECRTNLKSGRPIAPGTPLECPKCQVMFAAPKPRPAARPAPMVQPRHRDEVVDDVEVIDDVDVIDDVEVIDEVEVVDDAPARRRNGAPARRRPASADFEVVDDDEDDDFDDRPRKKFKSKKKKGSNAGLMIALVVVGVVVLLGGAGFGLYYLFGGGGADDPMAYVPADSQFVVGIDGAALLNSSFGPKIEALLSNPAFGGEFAKYKQETKATTKDLFHRIVIAGNSGRVTVIEKTNIAIDEAKMVAAVGNPTKATVGGKTVYRLKAGSSAALPGANPGIVAFPHKTVALTSNLADAQLESVFKSKGRTLTGDMATLVNKGSKGTVYGAVVLDAATRQQLTGALPPGGQANKAMEAVQTAKGAAFWLTLGSAEVELKVGLLMPDAAAAQKVTADFQTESAKQAPALKLGLNLVLGMPPSVKAMAQEMLGGLQFATEETMSVVTMKIKSTTLDAVIAEISGMAGQMSAPPPAAAQQGAPATRTPRRGVIRPPGGG